MSIENTRKAILSVAKVYLGYKEGYNNDNIFGDWYGMPNQPWCAMFVSYCMSKAGVSQNVVKKFASCTTGWNWFANRGETRNKDFVPQRGDIIFFDWDPEEENGIDHVGIVDRVENNTVYTVEGNNNDQVNEYSYPLGSTNIYGYVVPSYTGDETMSNTPTLIPSTGEEGETSSSYPTIAKGSTGTYVTLAQEKLISKGYPLSDYGADGIFGNETDSVVRDFQRDNGLVADGIIGKNTWAKLNITNNNMPSSYPGSVIGMGARGDNVVKIQNELIRRGYDVPGGADGQYGSGCKEAVIEFQEDNGLDADGIVGKQTWDMLFPQSGKGTSYPGFILTMGSRGSEVIVVQEKLMELGYDVPGGADGQYGSGVRNAVRKFQEDHGLDIDGDVGKQTWDALFPMAYVYVIYPGYLISEGMSSFEVKRIQQRLAYLGYSVGTIDSIFGTNTKNAVILFQQANSINADGIVGEQTWNKLFNDKSITTPNLDLNEPVYRMLEKLYYYAGQLYPGKSIYDKNLLVLQYLRYPDYKGEAWDLLAETPDYNWIAFVNNKNDPEINRNFKITTTNGTEIGLPHLAISTEVNLIKNNDNSLASDILAPISDLTGWAGDLVSFAAHFYDKRNERNLNSSLFSDEFTFGIEDLYQDMDAYGIYYLLNFMKISTAFKLYYSDNKATYANRRFSNFIVDRIVNGSTLSGIPESDTNQGKLTGLAQKYVSTDIGTLAGIFGAALLMIVAKNDSNANMQYDKGVFATQVASTFAGLIMLYSYKE